MASEVLVPVARECLKCVKLFLLHLTNHAILLDIKSWRTLVITISSFRLLSYCCCVCCLLFSVDGGVIFDDPPLYKKQAKNISYSNVRLKYFIY